MTRLTLMGEQEDIDITIARVGRRLVITTPRKGIATSMQRRMTEIYTGSKLKENVIGFQADDD